MRGKVTIAFFWGYCWLCPFLSRGQLPLKETLLQIKNGLPSDQVYQTVTDESGNLYVATNRGLCLYDGYRFIKNPYVKGAVWNLFRKGAVVYFYAPDIGLCSVRHIFDSINVIRPVDFADSIPENDHYEHLFVDDQNRIWCTDFHSIKYVTLSREAGHYLWDPQNTDVRKPIAFCQPEAGRIWAFSHKGFWVWDKHLRQFRLYPDQRLNSLSYITAFFDRQHSVYLATSAGNLLSFDLQTDSVCRLPDLPGEETPISITGMYGSQNQYILICTERRLYAFDLRKKAYELWYQAENALIKSLTVDTLHCLWLSTNHGLRKLMLHPDALQMLSLPGGKDKLVMTLATDSLGNIWSATSDNRIWKYTASGQWESYSLPGDDKVRCNNISVNGPVILAATSGGLYQFKKGRFQLLRLNGIVPGEPLKKAILDRNLHLWVLADGRPARVFDWPSFHYKKDYIRNPESFWRDNVLNDIVQNTDGKIWFAAWMPKDFGIVFYDTATRKLEPISPGNDRGLFMGDYYRKVALAASGALLFSGFGGWNMVSADGHITKLLNTSQYEVASNQVEGISADDSDHIWFATAEGLYRYDCKTNKVLRLSQTDGLPTDDLTNGYCSLPDAKLALGVAGGILLVDQQKILQSPLVNKFHLTAVKINGKLQAPSTAIELNNEQTDLTLYFSALTFAEEKIIYRYRFAEDTGWVSLGNVPELHLARLNHGYYKIIIQAGDHLQNWQQRQLEISLSVPAPFYKTMWFIALIVTFAGLLMFLVNRYLFRQQKIKEQLKRRLKDAKMQVLRSQMNPHFLFNTLNSINSYIIQNKTEDASDYLTMFSKLMRNILNNSKQSFISLRKELDTLRLYMELEGMRLEHSFDYTIHIGKDIDPEEISVPPLILQPFVENAIWHGLHNKVSEGILDIDIKRISESKLSISVSDNGIGRAAASLIKKGQSKSFGMDITMNRLALLNKGNTVEVIDLFDKHNRASGTRIVILLNF